MPKRSVIFVPQDAQFQLIARGRCVRWRADSSWLVGAGSLVGLFSEVLPPLVDREVSLDDVAADCDPIVEIDVPYSGGMVFACGEDLTAVGFEGQGGEFSC